MKSLILTIAPTIILTVVLFTGVVTYESTHLVHGQFFEDSDTNVTDTNTNVTDTNTNSSSMGSEIVLLSQKLKKTSFDSRDLIGQVKNIGTETADYVMVHLTVYNKNGEVIGTKETYAEPSTLKAGQKSTFEIFADTEDFKGMDHYTLALDWLNHRDSAQGYVENAQLYESTPKSPPPTIETAQTDPTLKSQDKVLIKLTPSGTTATGNVSPKDIKVKAGTTVVWQNMLPEKVYVQSKPDENHGVGELLNGTYIFPGEPREKKLNEVGTFIYDGSNGFGSYYVRGTITVVNETTQEKKIPTENPTTVPKSKKSYQLIIYLDNASTQNAIGDNFKILVYNSNNKPILSAKPNIDFKDDHQKISPPKGYPIIYRSGQYPKDINVCAQQEYQSNGTTNLHNDCYPIKQNVQKTYWYTIFDYGEIDGLEADSNQIAKSDKITPGTVTSDNKSESNDQRTGIITGMEQVTLEAQLKKDSLLTGWYDIKKFRLAVSDGSQICPSSNCEYTVEDGKIFSLGDSSSYRADGKLKVTIAEDGSSKSTLYPLGVTLDKTSEEESNGQKIGKLDGTFEVGPHITYQVTNATLELDKKSPVLTIQGERSAQNSTSSE